jgi:hypothetical protein
VDRRSGERQGVDAGLLHRGGALGDLVVVVELAGLRALLAEAEAGDSSWVTASVIL